METNDSTRRPREHRAARIISQKARQFIRMRTEKFLDAVIERRVVIEPFDEESYAEERPFHAALVPMEVWKASKFERSFTTSQGQMGFEGIAHAIASSKQTATPNKLTH